MALGAASLAAVTAVAAVAASPSPNHPTGIGIAKLGRGTVTSEPGWLSCGPTCQAPIPEGERVLLTARPDEGEEFVGWNGCDPANQPTCLVEVTDLHCIVAEFTGGGSSSTAYCSPVQPEVTPPPPPVGDHPPVSSPCTISGTRSPNVLRGTAADDVICGKGGNDTIYAGSGHDVVRGGSGNDRVFGQAGRDHASGGPGHDLLVGGGSDDELFGGLGPDLLRARDGLVDVVHGGRGRDRARVDPGDLLTSVERRA